VDRADSLHVGTQHYRRFALALVDRA